MRVLLTTVLLFSCLGASSQTINLRNDSLFIDNFFIDGSTDQPKIDSLLGASHTIIKSKDDYKKNPITGKNAKLKTAYYYEKGLSFRRYDFDKTALTVGIRMISSPNEKAVTKSGLLNSFKGQLIILENPMNDIKKSGQLKNMKNCEIEYRLLSTSAGECLMQAEIVRGKNQVTIVFDEYTREVIVIFISLNLIEK